MGLNMDIEKRVKDNVENAEIIGKLVAYKDGDKLKIAYIFEGDIPTSGSSTVDAAYIEALQNSVITAKLPAQGCCAEKENN